MKTKAFSAAVFDRNRIATGDLCAADLILSKRSFLDYLEEAEVCCEQARQAARSRRYKAAYGLFETAANLYQRALDVDGVDYPAVENRLRAIESEMMTYSDLIRGLERPLVRK